MCELTEAHDPALEEAMSRALSFVRLGRVARSTEPLVDALLHLGAKNLSFDYFSKLFDIIVKELMRMPESTRRYFAYNLNEKLFAAELKFIGNPFPDAQRILSLLRKAEELKREKLRGYVEEIPSEVYERSKSDVRSRVFGIKRE